MNLKDNIVLYFKKKKKKKRKQILGGSVKVIRHKASRNGYQYRMIVGNFNCDAAGHDGKTPKHRI